VEQSWGMREWPGIRVNVRAGGGTVRSAGVAADGRPWIPRGESAGRWMSAGVGSEGSSGQAHRGRAAKRQMGEEVERENGTLRNGPKGRDGSALCKTEQDWCQVGVRAELSAACRGGRQGGERGKGVGGGR